MDLTFVGIVISLLDQSKLLTLRLVKTTLDRVRFLQLLKSEHEKLRIVLVVERPGNS